MVDECLRSGDSDEEEEAVGMGGGGRDGGGCCCGGPRPTADVEEEEREWLAERLEPIDAFEDDRSRVIRVTEGLAAFGREEERGGRGRGRVEAERLGEEATEEGEEVWKEALD